MESLVISATSQTPRVSFDAATGNFEMAGRSIPEHPVDFYEPLDRWLDRYLQHPATRTVWRFELEYFNTSSSRCIMDLLKKLVVLRQEGHEVFIEWFYDRLDPEMRETAEDFKSVLRLPFSIIMTG